VNFFRSASHAGRVHDGEKQFKLVDVHSPSPQRCGRVNAEAVDVKCQLRFFSKLKSL
jgi:hypothetical protein